MRFIAIFILLFYFINYADSQNIIQGNIQDTLGQGVARASVSYGEIDKHNIFGYTMTDAQGNFSLSIKVVASEKLLLTINHISYQPKVITIINKSGSYNIKLAARIDKLQDVVVQNHQGPIGKKGDTINYSVDSFSVKQDRTIGDVIRKLPGIEMKGNQILYNGKPLSRYTIDKLNLMQGRYDVLNQSLPYDAISKVQIIENDQPIKILDSLVPSDQASLNLVLKKHNVTSGSGKLGIGASPLLWDANLTPITLMNGWQMLNSVQANNAGISLSDRMNTLTSERNPVANATTQFLNIQSAGTVPFDQTKWLDNDSKLISSNFTYKDKKQIEWRGAVSYINQLIRNESYTVTNYLTANQNIVVSDNVHNNNNTNDFNFNITAEKNEKNIHLKESILVSRKWNANNGQDWRNDTSNVIQKMQLQSSVIANVLDLTTKWGKQLISINSVTSYSESPQTLSVTPGPYINVLNDTVPYIMANQNVLYKRFQTSNSLGLIKSFKLFTVSVNTGFSYYNELLQSSLNIDSRLAGNKFQNNVGFLHPKLFFIPSLKFEKKRSQISLTLPIEWQQFQANYNKIATDSTTLSRLTINPALNFRYTLNNEWELRSAANYENNFGSLVHLYQSYILTSFNSLTRSGSYRVPQGSYLSGSISANYKNILTSRFANISVSYNKNKTDYISQTLIDDLGLSYQQLLAINNGGHVLSMSGNISQYFSRTKTIVKLSGSFNKNVSDQLVNNVFAPYTSTSYSGAVNIDNSYWNWMTLAYSGSYSFSKNYYPDRKLNDIMNLVQHLEANIFPKKDQMISTYADYYITNLKEQTNQMFLNLKYTISIPKHKLDFALTFNNILNTKEFISQYNTSYYLVYREFHLRPRQFLASVRFNFNAGNRNK